MIPLATTSVSVSRQVLEAGADPYDSTPVASTIATGVRAVIAPPTSATLRLVGGDRVVYNTKLQCDPTPIYVGDTVTDETTDQAWTVEWVQQPNQLGLSFTLAGLRLVTGRT